MRGAEDSAVSSLLEVRDLRTVFAGDDGEFAVVNGVSFSEHPSRNCRICAAMAWR